MKKKDFVKVSIYLPKKILPWVKDMAEQNAITSSAFIRCLIIQAKNDHENREK